MVNKQKVRRKRGKKNPLRILFFGTLALLALAAILSAGIFFFPYLEARNLKEPAVEAGADLNGVMTPENWMIDIPDSTNLAEINLPGAKSAGSTYVEQAYLNKRQKQNVEELLKSGFRYLQLGLTVSDKEGLIVAEDNAICRTGVFPFSSPLKLDNVLEECYSFLSENPTETIVLHLGQGADGADVAKIQTLLDKTIEKNSDYWYLSDEIPELGQVRGKIVLFRSYQDLAALGERAGIPLYWEDAEYVEGEKYQTTYVEDKVLVYVQDMDVSGADEKWDTAEGLIEDCPAIAISYTPVVTVNVLSVKETGAFKRAFTSAKKVNEKLMEATESMSETEKRCLGWVIVDYGNRQIGQAIYTTNYIE